MAKGNTGTRNGNWKGGRSLASNGYVLIRVGKDHHLADVRGYAYEHRLVAEEKLGRRLLQGEIPHHVNGDKADNRPENIEVLRSHAHHRAEHRKPGSTRKNLDEPNVTIACACGCGNTFWKYDATGRPRRFVSGHNPQHAPAITAILKALQQGRMKRSALSDMTGIPLNHVSTILCKLQREGIVRSLKQAHWELTKKDVTYG